MIVSDSRFSDSILDTSLTQRIPGRTVPDLSGHVFGPIGSALAGSQQTPQYHSLTNNITTLENKRPFEILSRSGILGSPHGDAGLFRNQLAA